MKLSSFKSGRVHFIGCGGAGTQPLMKIFHDLGYKVSGSDLEESPYTEALKKLGLETHVGHKASNIPSEPNTLVVRTSAAGPGNPEFDEAERRGLPCILRGAALGLLAEEFESVIAVSGSHGKTSISAMTAHILKVCGLKPGYLVGGKVCGWDFSGSAGAGKIFVTEADESDGTHTLISSSVAVVPNVEDDHAWNVGGVEALLNNFKSFAGKAKLVLYGSSETSDRLFADHPATRRFETAKLSAAGNLPGLPKGWGGYQRFNGALAVEAAVAVGAERAQAVAALASYPGVERRMSLRFESPSFKLIEDYAHHPTELAASLSALRETNPGRRLLVVFQPHRYARLAMYVDLFAKELKNVPRAFITPVFAAWTASGRIDSKELARRIGPSAKAIEGSWERMAEEVLADVERGDLVAVVGAGDLKEIIPLLEEGFRRKEQEG